MTRTKLVPLFVFVLGAAAIGTILLLEHRSGASRGAELRLAAVKIELNRLQNAPFRASPATGGSPAIARQLMRTGKRRVTGTLNGLLRDSPPPALRGVAVPLRANFATLDAIYAIGASGAGYGRRADRLAAAAGRTSGEATALLDSAGSAYHGRASRSQAQATAGTVGAILLLLGAFWILYRRSVRARARAECLSKENERLLAASRHEARTDALTGLPNRRALVSDLAGQLRAASDEQPIILALYDLDGFKHYNDTFGHPAGDALLARLGERLEAALADGATAYRMGGDEFCVVASATPERGEAILAAAAAALFEAGDAFEIGCSYGVTHVPLDATSIEEALRLADQRMYQHKASRSSASRQSTDVLLQVLSERSAELHEHLNGVAELARVTAERLRLPEHEVRRIELAAALHDVGKAAIPETILDKPGRLEGDEWDFMRRHTVIGERIVRAAPSLAHTAELVRWSHERVDGTGYPDALGRGEIPLGASIIAACDAFHAMVSERPYRRAMSVPEALAELRRCSGTQFEPSVVETFCAFAKERDAILAQAA